ncbi:hypothetical protein FJTKL_00174 [Diaporthe vaccinii]|uniref:Protein kinase domain-containing protein n=1 Tax=Diaporthe vaccinii TaxID=105482 RepID=A0ABR4E427_9PEZI
MSRSPGGSGQRSIDDKDLETRIEDCLDGVLSTGLARCERISRRTGPDKKSFFCRSDLERIWSSEPRPIDAVFGHLSEEQRKALLEDLLLFISFLVKVGVRSRFILSCQDVFFGDAESTTTKFKDADGPVLQRDLLRMGLNPLQAHSWEVQYIFRPAKITFAAERWEPQQIEDPRVPLPFELIDHVHSGIMIHGGFGDDTGYESQYGTVRLCRIPEEYIGNAIRSETWRPEAPLLRIVKSFKARQNMIEEARNMELLKQSLQKMENISIHDAIIEQIQEDDTEIVSIVSPYASLGDLAQFLAGGCGITRGQWGQIYDVDEQFPRAADAHQLKMSLLGQSKNLASALEFLHNGFTTSANDWKIKCAHLDLKPSNILIFETSQRDEVVGNWKLCDFGISVFGAERLQGSPTVELGSAGDFFNRVENTIRTSPRRIPGSYQAPEIEHSDDRRNPDFGARTSDIWSFGAIFAEVLAFAEGRASAVESFKQERRRQTTVHGDLWLNDFFYTTVPENMGETYTLPCILRREVSQWLNNFISEHEPVHHPPGVCLRCWAECVKSILEVNPRKRPSATTLYQWVGNLRTHANDTSIAHVQFRASGPLSPTLEWAERDHENALLPSEAPAVPQPVFNPKGTSHLVKLPLSSHDVIDYDLDGQRLAYLTKTSIELFLIGSQGPDHHQVEQLQSGHGWRGIKVAEPYLVVWGSDLRVYIISNGQLSRAQNSARNMSFNATRRVAVSRRGYVAGIHNDEILVLDAKLVPQR